MREPLIVLIGMILSLEVHAQQVVIKDSISKQPLSFSTIRYGENGFYTDKNGSFNLKNVDSPTFTISSVGYKDKEFKKSKVKEVIYLPPRAIHLKEVSITAKKSEVIEIKPGRKVFWFSDMSNWLLHKKGEEIIAVLHPTDNYKNMPIKKVRLNFDKVKERKALKNKNTKIFIRLKLFDLKDSKLDNLLFGSSPIPVNSYAEDEINIDVDDPILFNPDGIAFVVEMIDFEDRENLPGTVNEPLLRPALTMRGDNKYFSTKSYIKNGLEKSGELIPINKRILKFTGKKLDRNLSIGLELMK